MTSDPSSIDCAVSLEWITANGAITKSVKYKTASTRIIRNQFRDMFLTITNKSGAHHKFLLKNVNVFKKFILDGKATIKIGESNVNVLLSNAPTSSLLDFLKVLFIKISSAKSSPRPGVREKLLSLKEPAVNDISPVNEKDLNRVKTDKTKTEIFPNRKRALSQQNERVAKKPCHTPLSSLTNEQKAVLEAVKKGANVFFTGSAGTGKSFLLKSILNSLPPDTTAATASTGAAACLIGGITLHSFAGIGSGEADLAKCLDLARRPMVTQGWKKCRHLVIDEISMVDGPFFEKVETVAREIRGNDKVFGGLQLIVCGDFLQLPPVSKADNKFCFMTDTWSRCGFINFNLTQVYRQSDSTFVEMLNLIRMGKVTEKIEETLKNTSTQKIEKSGVLATRLCCHTKEAKLINDSKLAQLPGEGKVFEAQDSSAFATSYLDEGTPVEKKIMLKENAQVMLLKNIDLNRGLVNGARGIVMKITNGLPTVKFLSGLVYEVKPEKWLVKTVSGAVHSRTQLPLKLAWAFSIHKSQGLTLDCVEMCLAKTFEAGQAYVALSRAKSLSSLRVVGFSSSQVWANTDVIRFYRNLNSYIPDYIPLGEKFKKKKSLTQ